METASLPGDDSRATLYANDESAVYAVYMYDGG